MATTKLKHLAVNLTEAQIKTLRATATKEGCTCDELIRNLIDKNFKTIQPKAKPSPEAPVPKKTEA